MYEFDLSTIICIYNTPEKKLYQCVKSIIDENIKHEIIIIDDGSSHDYTNFLKSMDLAHIKYYKQPTNKSLFQARITGAKLASGKYIHYIDGDDIIIRGSYKNSLDFLNNHETDILQVYNITNTRSTKKYFLNSYSPSCLGLYIIGEEIIKRFCMNGLYHWPVWDKIYSMGLIKNTLHIFDKFHDIHLNYEEDLISTFVLYLNARKLIFYPDAYYVYNQSSDSLVGKIKNRNLYYKWLCDIKNVTKILNIVIEEDVGEGLKDICHEFYTRIFIYHKDLIGNEHIRNRYLNEFKESLKREYITMYKDHFSDNELLTLSS